MSMVPVTSWFTSYFGSRFKVVHVFWWFSTYFGSLYLLVPKSTLAHILTWFSLHVGSLFYFGSLGEMVHIFDWFSWDSGLQIKNRGLGLKVLCYGSLIISSSVTGGSTSSSFPVSMFRSIRWNRSELAISSHHSCGFGGI